ncbi:MAG TPA: Fur family transcriptional regulator [Planctomycetota bacterium]|nr:Fur family transcriptional regulator [Planctomycetota bacterium]
MRVDLGTFQDRLRGRGLKLTRPRRLVAEKLLSTGGHLAADDLIQLLRKDGTPVGRATVYRTLAILRTAGLFDEHDFGSGHKVYERAIGRPHHDHLYCISCGAVIEFREPRIESLQDEVTRRYRFTAMYHSHKIFGYCRRCRGRAPAPARTERND